ncbi:kinetochore-associated Ndc80 complex subunit SPC24 SCDLUD_003986 [Saccharomycodes ludwigii]|uniref:kinetochore-associated Ndc80 complex subunit SPC24 n=1 Tax=Saccharomycodes ludwigii TaxID=36035 RepID=UPI001E8B4162|nr:hypothetical protein SCDLUD_003986 [Saccharomycodes ludwigii]KAH3899701.1 hypothetical protein SCDLUD_003986 [Saccharomycodes ludwigii]
MTVSTIKEATELLRETTFTLNRDTKTAAPSSIRKIKESLESLHDTFDQNIQLKTGQLVNLNEKYNDLSDNIKVLNDKHITNEKKCLDIDREIDQVTKNINILQNDIMILRNKLDADLKEYVENTDNTNGSDIHNLDKDTTNFLKLQLFKSLGLLIDLEKHQLFIKENEVYNYEDEDTSNKSNFMKAKYIWDKL